MRSAPRTTSAIVPGPVGDLEIVLDEPASDAPPQFVAVVCHPHPLMGGSMTNKVVHILARTFNDLGAPSVRFNFRGVGKSAGTHDDGQGETDDVIALLNWTREQWPHAKIWLGGFSFGAAMALGASLRFPVDRLVTVAPALRWLSKLEGKVPDCPWLIVQGDQDELVDVDAVKTWAAALSRPPTLQILGGAEHFFHGRLNDLREAVSTWMRGSDASA
jgi:uncharacterized protein